MRTPDRKLLRRRGGHNPQVRKILENAEFGAAVIAFAKNSANFASNQINGRAFSP
jgi:hypothetical protein